MSTLAASADVSEEAVIGAGTKVWHLAQVRESAQVGEAGHPLQQEGGEWVCPATGVRYIARDGVLSEA